MCERLWKALHILCILAPLSIKLTLPAVPASVYIVGKTSKMVLARKQAGSACIAWAWQCCDFAYA